MNVTDLMTAGRTDVYIICICRIAAMCHLKHLGKHVVCIIVMYIYVQTLLGQH